MIRLSPHKIAALSATPVNALLPALATYLGYVCITYTQVYLRATAELLEMANQRFHHNFRQNVLKKGEVT